MTVAVVVSGRVRRRRAGASRRFAPTPELNDALQAILVELIELHLQCKQAHWNVVGRNFRDLHLQLDAIVDIAREGADNVAERMRAVGSVPDGRTDVVAMMTTLPEFPSGKIDTLAAAWQIKHAVGFTVDAMRTRRNKIDSEDPATTDLIHGLISDLEKQAWMLEAELESRS